MIASEQEEMLGILHLESEQQAYCLHTHVATIHIVTQQLAADMDHQHAEEAHTNQVTMIRRISHAIEKSQQIMELPMHIT